MKCREKYLTATASKYAAVTKTKNKLNKVNGYGFTCHTLFSIWIL